MLQRKRILIALTTALIAGLVIRLRGKAPTQPEKSVKPRYEAPISNPNAWLELPPITPDAYAIHLAPGHSLDEHSSTIGTNMTAHVDHFAPLSSRVVYFGYNISDLLLVAIRSDPKVERIFYHRSPLPEGYESPAHKAPLQGCDAPRDQIELHSFQVLLAPDYSLKQHSEVIGQDITQLIQNKYNFHTNKWVYSAKPVNLELLQAIRADENVELVVCESKVKRQTEGDLRPKKEL